MPTHSSHPILIIAASQREGSYNTQLATLVATNLKNAGHHVALPDYAALAAPIFPDDNSITRANMPAGIQSFADALDAARGVIFVAPEYNWSIPASLKNLIDWVSCLSPCPLTHKYGLLMAASPSRRGGVQGLTQLRAPLEGLGVHLHPAMFPLAQAHIQLNASGIADPEVAEKLEILLTDYSQRLQAQPNPT